MKYLKKTILFSLTISILFITFFSVYVPVCASDHGGSGGTDHGQLTEEEKRVKKLEIVDNIEKYLLFLCSEIGVYFSGSGYSDFYKNYVDYVKSTNDKWFEDNVSVSDDGNAVFSETLMSSLKAYIDQYAKENEPYYTGTTYSASSLDYGNLSNMKNVYDTVKNLVNDSNGYLLVMFNKNAKRLYVSEIDDIKDVGFVSDSKLYYTSASMYKFSTWNAAYFPEYYLDFTYDDPVISTLEEFKGKATLYNHQNYGAFFYSESKTNKVYTSWLNVYNIISSKAVRFRIFNSFTDFQNFSLDKRSVYYTSNYYTYVPEDLSVSIDDLQKTVDDLSGVVDQLLDKITKDTDESEIEDLLKQILDELKNNQGGGGGTGGGGDVNVDIDLSTTNNWLSKIYAKVSQIFDKMSETVSGASDAVHAKMQESLDEIIVQLKKIKRWTAVDTVVDGVDAIGDWLDLIRDVLKDAKEGAGSAVASLSSAVGDSVDLMSKKFPFSIPWDILFFVSALSAEPQVPHFEIPFNIELSALDITIDYTMELDFSQLQWLSDLSRLLLSMTYAVGLMKLTFGVTSVGKEE